MVLSDLNEAEAIVNNSKSLHWDGWDIVFLKQDDYAEYLQEGFFNREDGQWYRKSVYPCTENGWSIPDSVLV